MTGSGSGRDAIITLPACSRYCGKLLMPFLATVYSYLKLYSVKLLLLEAEVKRCDDIDDI